MKTLEHDQDASELIVRDVSEDWSMVTDVGYCSSPEVNTL